MERPGKESAGSAPRKGGKWTQGWDNLSLVEEEQSGDGDYKTATHIKQRVMILPRIKFQ